MPTTPRSASLTEQERLVATRSGDRPRSHAGTSDTELAIFEAAERLLAEIPLHELSVAQIIGAAAISRATFYFYFSSKFAVVSGLLARVMEEIFEVVQPFVQRREGISPEQALRHSLEGATALWRSHRPAMRAIHEHWNTTPELRTLWISVVERFTDAVSAELDRERAAGIAPPGVGSRQIAAALLWGTERCLYVAGLGVDPDLADEEQTLEPLLALWVGSLYGGWSAAGPAKPAPPGRAKSSA
jgi:TetR/AcrR family transcriptional regulator, ethionamide resistance regulator